MLKCQKVNQQIVKSCKNKWGFTCNYPKCNYKSDQKGHLIQHISKVHEGRKKLACEICPHCDQIFSRKDNLNQHISSVHEGERNFECKCCDKSYSSGQKLKEHISKVHEGKKKQLVKSVLIVIKFLVGKII